MDGPWVCFAWLIIVVLAAVSAYTDDTPVHLESSYSDLPTFRLPEHEAVRGGASDNDTEADGDNDNKKHKHHSKKHGKHGNSTRNVSINDIDLGQNNGYEVDLSSKEHHNAKKALAKDKNITSTLVPTNATNLKSLKKEQFFDSGAKADRAEEEDNDKSDKSSDSAREKHEKRQMSQKEDIEKSEDVEDTPAQKNDGQKDKEKSEGMDQEGSKASEKGGSKEDSLGMRKDSSSAKKDSGGGTKKDAANDHESSATALLGRPRQSASLGSPGDFPTELQEGMNHFELDIEKIKIKEMVTNFKFRKDTDKKRRIGRWEHKERLDTSEPSNCGFPVCAVIDMRPKRFKSLCALVNHMQNIGLNRRVLEIQKGGCEDVIERQGLDRPWASEDSSPCECKDHAGCAAPVCINYDGKAKSFKSTCEAVKHMAKANKQIAVAAIGLGQCYDLYSSCMLTEWFDLDEPCKEGDVESVYISNLFAMSLGPQGRHRSCAAKNINYPAEFVTLEGTSKAADQVFSVEKDKLVCENAKNKLKPKPPFFWVDKEVTCRDFKMRYCCKRLWGEAVKSGNDVIVDSPSRETLFDDCDWLNFMSVTDGSGQGDLESRERNAALQPKDVCKMSRFGALYIDARRVKDDMPWDETGEVITKNTPTFGFYCDNTNNEAVGKKCSDYKVRYCCQREVASQWGAWAEWSKCTRSCGGGTRNRDRVCVQKKGDKVGCFNDGPMGEKRFRFMQEDCGKLPCPKALQWQPWLAWSVCSVTCGKGTRKRSRGCFPPRNGGEDCPPPGDKQYFQEGDCHAPPCQNPEWTPWSEWSKCSVSCGLGTQSRRRSCQDQHSKVGMKAGEDCPGPDTHDNDCDTGYCPVDGGWTAWQNWGECTTACGEGTRRRFRYCAQPFPMHGGKNCEGNDQQKGDCPDLPPCPQHCLYSEWGEWSSCSVTCGENAAAGTRVRQRFVAQEAKYGGLKCHGALSEVTMCVLCAAPTEVKAAVSVPPPPVVSSTAGWNGGSVDKAADAGSGAKAKAVEVGSVDRAANAGSIDSATTAQMAETPAQTQGSKNMYKKSQRVLETPTFNQEEGMDDRPPKKKKSKHRHKHEKDSHKGKKKNKKSKSKRNKDNGFSRKKRQDDGASDFVGNSKDGATLNFGSDQAPGSKRGGGYRSGPGWDQTEKPTERPTETEKPIEVETPTPAWQTEKPIEVETPSPSWQTEKPTERPTEAEKPIVVQTQSPSWQTEKPTERATEAEKPIEVQTQSLRWQTEKPPEIKSDHKCLNPCPIDCKLSPWSPWTGTCRSCYKPAQKASVSAVARTRTRFVDVAAENGGNTCKTLKNEVLTMEQGAETENKPCQPDVDVPPCPVVAGSPFFVMWGEWSDCVAECGGKGKRKRTRACRTETSASSNKCTGGEDTETQVCEGICPAAGWTEWDDWSPCEVTCGRGQSARRRTCRDDAREDLKPEDKTCKGIQRQTRVCDSGSCSHMEQIRTEGKDPTGLVKGSTGGYGGAAQKGGGKNEAQASPNVSQRSASDAEAGGKSDAGGKAEPRGGATIANKGVEPGSTAGATFAPMDARVTKSADSGSDSAPVSPHSSRVRKNDDDDDDDDEDEDKNDGRKRHRHKHRHMSHRQRNRDRDDDGSEDEDLEEKDDADARGERVRLSFEGDSGFGDVVLPYRRQKSRKH